jgi:hypothetical protein
MNTHKYITLEGNLPTILKQSEIKLKTAFMEYKNYASGHAVA